MSVAVDGSTAMSSITLNAGEDYYIVASGVASLAHDGRQMDAEYAGSPTASKWSTSSSSGFDWNLGLGSAGSVSRVSWGAYDSTHVYGVHFTGTGNALAAKYFDDNYSDNSGNLVLSIYEVTKTTLSINPGSVTVTQAATGQTVTTGTITVTAKDQNGSATSVPGVSVYVFNPDGTILNGATVNITQDQNGTTFTVTLPDTAGANTYSIKVVGSHNDPNVTAAKGSLIVN